MSERRRGGGGGRGGLLLEHNRSWTSSITQNVDELPREPGRKWVRRVFWTKKKNRVHVHTPARWDTLEGVAASARMCSGVLRLGGAFSGDYISSFSQSDRKSDEVWNLCSGESLYFFFFSRRFPNALDGVTPKS